ncbi:MAG: GFA family protein [Deltaproteobacteria bacterium]|nr:GFA family protein [Deltaproteobacteria bacterium]
MSGAEGQCFCGAVAFAIDFPTKWVAHCHCSMCRRAHGAAFVTWVSVPSAQLRITNGQECIGAYKSSADAERRFCKTCGSPLFFESFGRWKGEVHIARAHFPGALDREPQVHSFFDDRAPWFHVNDQVPKRGGKTGTEPL